MPIRSYAVQGRDFKKMFAQIQDDLVEAPAVHVGEWQSQRLEMPMRELRNLSFSMSLPETKEELADITGAHLPWAEDHFLERVSGEPMNPAPSEAWWPFAKKKDGDTNTDHKSEGKAFSHTYPERMWPKFAGHIEVSGTKIARGHLTNGQMGGIRFEYGDLQDVVNQLAKSPMTRQAFLPIWFPEDTGAVHGKRVPCTLGYHFAIRNNALTITYYMRSTDLLRHFQDDVYLAGRLAQWVVGKVNDQKVGRPYFVDELIFHTANMHIFDGDVPMIAYRKSQGQVWIG